MQGQPPREEHAAEEKINWLKLATKFSADGDLKGMRACAQEVERLKDRCCCRQRRSSTLQRAR